MSTHPPIDALKSAREENKTLKYILVGVFLLSTMGMFLIHELPAHVTLHVAPNLRAGDQITVKDGRNEVPAPNVYAFAIYIWQQVNRWPKDGAKDYETQLFAFQTYLTPACYEQLKNDREARNNNGELIQRTRSLSQIPGQAYTSNRIVPDGANAWTVLLDMHVFETARGVPVKDTYVRYPMRVVEYDIDREKNPFQLALDCFGGNKPERLDPSVAPSAALSAAGTTKPMAGVAAPLPSIQASQASALPPPSTLPRDPVDQPTRP